MSKVEQKIVSKDNRKRISGVVVSDKMNKTVVVEVVSLKMHPKYKKQYKVSKRYKAHDENNVFKIGDRVVIVETKPISRDKHWEVLLDK